MNNVITSKINQLIIIPFDNILLVGLCLLKENKEINRSDNSTNSFSNRSGNSSNNDRNSSGSSSSMNSHHERSSYGNRESTSSTSIKYQQIKKMAIIFFSLEDNTLGHEDEDTITSFIDVYNNTKFPAYR